MALDFIRETSENYFTCYNGNKFNVANEGIIYRFLEEPSLLFLGCYCTENNMLFFFNDVVSIIEHSPCLVYLKIQPGILDSSNIRDMVFTTSVVGSVLENLYRCLKELYAPLIMKVGDKEPISDQSVQTAVGELMSTLFTELKAARHDKALITNGRPTVPFWRAFAHSQSQNVI
ncbi:unnamed protein product [Dicrocoelium dendriticum]|nr:unnamed protein product [Dicrocoelium dendriticum]